MASRAYEAKFKRDIVTCSRLGLELFMHLEYKYALRMMFFSQVIRDQKVLSDIILGLFKVLVVLT